MTKIVIISAPSGAGKTTIVKHLLKTFPQLEFSISVTSRPKRDGELEGREYYFMSPDEFREKISQNLLLEWEEVYAGNFYGTLKSEVDRILKNDHVPIFDVDVVGGCHIKQQFGTSALSLFIAPPNIEILEQRLRIRGTETEENIQKRISKARWEMEFAPKFDKILVNHALEQTFVQVEEILTHFFNNGME